MPERLQKILARHGLGSRREIERWIAEGRITINRQPAQLGAQFNEGDRVAIDGKEVTARLAIEVPAQVLMFHKSQGQPITREGARDVTRGGERDEVDAESADDARETVMERLPAVRGARWVPLNPMHGGDSGLLLLTNDGALNFALTRRKRWIPCSYMVRVLAPGASLEPPEIPPTVQFDDEQIEFSKIEPAGGEGANLWYRVELPRADRRGAVRALFESRDMKVSRMTQVAFGDIELPRDLPRGRHRALTADQVARLYALAQLKAPVAPDPSTERAARKSHRRPAPDRRRAPKKKNSAKKRPSR
jgi:23S rRNA pseudouridine2605 synthase